MAPKLTIVHWTFFLEGASCHLQGLQEMFKLASPVHGDDDDDDCDENDANNQCRHCTRIVGPEKQLISSRQAFIAWFTPTRELSNNWQNHYQKDRMIAVLFGNLLSAYWILKWRPWRKENLVQDLGSTSGWGSIRGGGPHTFGKHDLRHFLGHNCELNMFVTE